MIGCIDITQHITRQTDGTDRVTICVTIPKALIEKIAKIHDKPIDDEQLSDMQDEFGVSDYDRFSAKKVIVNNEASFGYLIMMNLDYTDEDTQQAVNAGTSNFIPKYEKEKITISLTSSTTDLAAGYSDNEEISVFLSMCKYRLLVEKTSMPSLSKVVLKTKEKPIKIDYLDLYDQYLIEIPIIALLGGATRIELCR